MLAEKETKRILGVAFELVCAGLRTGDCDDDVKEAIAKKIIQLANGGERNPDLLCERVLKDIRTPQSAEQGTFALCKAKEDRIALCNEKVSLPPAYRYAAPATVLAGLFLWSALSVARSKPRHLAFRLERKPTEA
jgi:hypothetical protein